MPRVKFPRVQRSVQDQRNYDGQDGTVWSGLRIHRRVAHASPDSRKNLADSSGGVGLM